VQASYGRSLFSRARIPDIRVRRHLPEIFVKNTGSFTLSVDDPTGTCVALHSGEANTSGNNTYDWGFAMTFRFDQILNYAEFAAIADEYKINGVRVKIWYLSTGTDVNSTSIMPQLMWSTDYIDGNPESRLNLRERQDAVTRPFSINKPCTMTMVPKSQNVVYSNASALTNAYAPAPKPQWLNMVYSNAEHYGIKGVLMNVSGNLPTVNLENFKFDVEVDFSVRGID
jgi:hypothetical protein